MEEIWKDIQGYEGLYQVSNLGRVKSLPRRIVDRKNNRFFKGRVLKSYLDKDGYPTTIMSNKNKKRVIHVHRLVAETFIPNPENKGTVNHIDGNKQNNRVGNLEWCTQLENIRHAFSMGLKNNNHCTGEANYASKLSESDVKFMRANFISRSKDFGITAMAKRFNITTGHAAQVIYRKVWKHVKEN
jgi:hypothetical protein